jgi:hypothetical protein
MNKGAFMRNTRMISEEVKMRGISLLLLGAILASCAATPEQPIRSAKGQQAFQTLVAGKTARPELSCVPSLNANDMTVIDGRTLAFRRGTGTVYIVNLTPGCELAGGGTYALVSRQFGGQGLCRGDIQQVMDLTNRITVGSCTIGAITPYVRAGRGY